MVLDALIRVSQVRGRKGERFISPAVQLDQIGAWLGANQCTLGEVFEELDVSGTKAKRPDLERAIERVENGLSDGLIVAKLDRLGRSLIQGLAAIARIEKAGGTFVSVQDSLDLKTPTGRLVLRVLFSVAEWEIDRLRSSWGEARGKAIARGVYISAIPPIGYLRGDDGRLVVDPDLGPYIAEAFRLRASAASSGEIAAFLNGCGLRTQHGNEFSPSMVHSMIGNRAYLGEARCHPHVHPNAHEPVTDPATWQRAQYPPRRSRRAASLLAGVLRCAGCGRAMTAVHSKSRHVQVDTYRCFQRRATHLRCPEPAAVRADEIEPLVESMLFNLARGRGISKGEKIARIRAEEVELAETDLAAYRDNARLLRTLGAESFEAGIEARQRRLERALLALAEARRRIEQPAVPTDHLATRWLSMELDERRAMIEEFVDLIAVERGNGPTDERAWVCRRGEGPPAGWSSHGLRPFEQKGGQASRLPVPRLWSEPKIKSALTAFTGNRSDFPTYAEFAAAGFANVYGQVMRWGGPYYWARKIGLSIPANRVNWNERNVRNALAAFLQDKAEWPSQSEFERAGLKPLHSAVYAHGGRAYWATQFGLHAPDRQRLWPMERIERELGLYLNGWSHFPSKPDFERDGRRRLYNAARRYGGLRHWREHFGLPAANQSEASRARHV